MDIIAYKGRPVSFLLMNLHIICTNTLVGDHLVLKKDPFLEHPASQTYINKKLHSGVDCQTLTKYSATFFANVTEHFVEIMQ